MVVWSRKLQELYFYFCFSPIVESLSLLSSVYRNVSMAVQITMTATTRVVRRGVRTTTRRTSYHIKLDDHAVPITSECLNGSGWLISPPPFANIFRDVIVFLTTTYGTLDPITLEHTYFSYIPSESIFCLKIHNIIISCVLLV